MAFSGGTTLGASESSQMPGKEKPISHISTENYALFIGIQGPNPPQSPSSESFLSIPSESDVVCLGSTLRAHVSTHFKKMPKLEALLCVMASSIQSRNCIHSPVFQFCYLNRIFSTVSSHIGIDLVHLGQYSWTQAGTDHWSRCHDHSSRCHGDTMEHKWDEQFRASCSGFCPSTHNLSISATVIYHFLFPQLLTCK